MHKGFLFSIGQHRHSNVGIHQEIYERLYYTYLLCAQVADCDINLVITAFGVQ